MPGTTMPGRAEIYVAGYWAARLSASPLLHKRHLALQRNASAIRAWDYELGHGSLLRGERNACLAQARGNRGVVLTEEGSCGPPAAVTRTFASSSFTGA